MPSALEICRQNVEIAKERKRKKEEDAARLRGDFPFAVACVEELQTHDPALPDLKPRVMAMTENGKEWKR